VRYIGGFIGSGRFKKLTQWLAKTFSIYLFCKYFSIFVFIRSISFLPLADHLDSDPLDRLGISFFYAVSSFTALLSRKVLLSDLALFFTNFFLSLYACSFITDSFWNPAETTCCSRVFLSWIKVPSFITDPSVFVSLLVPITSFASSLNG